MHITVADDQFVELTGLRGLRIARLGRQADGRTLDVIEGVRGVVIPAMAHPSAEHGRVLAGRVRFMKAGVITDLVPGDRWDVAAGETQGPHIILDNDTQVALLRDGKSAFDA